MKVFYKTEYRPKDYPEYKYFETTPEFCCAEMKEVWDEAIKFGAFDDYGSHVNNRINISHCDAFPEGACWDSYPITFCPFCGEHIEVIEKERINYVKKVEKQTTDVESWVKQKP